MKLAVKYSGSHSHFFNSNKPSILMSKSMCKIFAKCSQQQSISFLSAWLWWGREKPCLNLSVADNWTFLSSAILLWSLIGNFFIQSCTLFSSEMRHEHVSFARLRSCSKLSHSNFPSSCWRFCLKFVHYWALFYVMLIVNIIIFNFKTLCCLVA